MFKAILINLKMMKLNIEIRPSKNGLTIILIKKVSMEPSQNFLSISSKEKSLKIKLKTMVFGSTYYIIIDIILTEPQRISDKLWQDLHLFQVKWFLTL